MRLKIRDEQGDNNYVINPFRVVSIKMFNIKNLEAGAIILLSTNDELYCTEPFDIAVTKWENALNEAYVMIIANVVAEELANDEDEADEEIEDEN